MIRILVVSTAILLAPNLLLSQDGSDCEDSSTQKIWAVQINVSNIDVAIDFYTKTLGVELASRDYYPVVVSLNSGGSHILLYNVGIESDPLPKGSVPHVNWRVPSLENMLTKFEQDGHRVDSEKPETFALGRYVGLRDPSGNYLELVELDDKLGSVKTTKLYNVEIPINNHDEALDFYKLLGFESYSDTYWPPAIPVFGGGMELVLFASDNVMDMRYPNEPGVYIILEVSDIEERVRQLSNLGLIFLYENLQTHSPVGIFTAIRDPFGNVIELIEPVQTPFDLARDRDAARKIKMKESEQKEMQTVKEEN